MRTLASLSLRNRFLLLVLVGAVLPLGIAGLWLSSSARRSGQELVRARLEQSLSRIVDATGRRWTISRSLLLDLGDSRVVQAALKEGRTLSAVTDTTALRELEGLWIQAAAAAASVDIRDQAGEFVGRLPGDLDVGQIPSPPQESGFLLYRLPIRDRFSGTELGGLEVRLRAEGLVPPGIVTAGVSGSVLALFDVRTGDPLMPLAMDPELFIGGRFTWLGEDWLGVERRVSQPPVRFVLAGPVGPVTRPFEEAARRGSLVLVVMALGIFILVTLFTRRLTRSLEHLSEVAAGVSRGDLSRRAEEQGSPEVRGTARAFNTMTESLAQTLQKLSQQEAVAAMGEFAASLAHEVRNPLTSIRVDLQRTRRKMDADPTEAAILVDRALREVERLNESVSNFLRIARSGGVSLERVDLRLPLEAAANNAKSHFENKGAIFEHTPVAEPIWVHANEGALEQLVLNLLLNAADALQPCGRAGLSVEVQKTDVTVSVWDEGTGIEPADLGRIFDPFFSTKDEGTGLGLSVAQRIARAHGSEVEVESAPGARTTLRFTLPIEAG